MKRFARQKLPPGWTEEKIHAVIAHYDQQTDDEGAAEIESAPVASEETWMAIPTELVGEVTHLIEARKPKTKPVRSQNHKRKHR